MPSYHPSKTATPSSNSYKLQVIVTLLFNSYNPAPITVAILLPADRVTLKSGNFFGSQLLFTPPLT